MSSMYVLTNELSFEIAEFDLIKENEWIIANQECMKLGERWRVPTKLELEAMYSLHKKGIGGFKLHSYWTSEGNNNYYAKSINFLNGKLNENFNSKEPTPKFWVRPVRNI